MSTLNSLEQTVSAHLQEHMPVIKSVLKNPFSYMSILAALAITPGILEGQQSKKPEHKTLAINRSFDSQMRSKLNELGKTIAQDPENHLNWRKITPEERKMREYLLNNHSEQLENALNEKSVARAYSNYPNREYAGEMPSQTTITFYDKNVGMTYAITWTHSEEPFEVRIDGQRGKNIMSDIRWEDAKFTAIDNEPYGLQFSKDDELSLEGKSTIFNSGNIPPAYVGSRADSLNLEIVSKAIAAAREQRKISKGLTYELYSKFKEEDKIRAQKERNATMRQMEKAYKNLQK